MDFRGLKRCLWAGIAFALPALFSTQVALAQVKLEYKFSEGQKHTYKSTVKTSQTLTLMGQGIQTEATEKIVSSTSVGKKRSDGTTPVEEKVEALNVEMSLPGGIVVTYDSKDPAPKVDNPQLAFLTDIYKLVSQMSYTVVLDDQNKVKAVEGAEKIVVAFSDGIELPATVVGADGRIYAYDCNGPVHGGWPTEYGPCTVARVGVADVADADAYRYWNGATWIADRSGAVAVSMPDGRDGVTNLPVGGVNVVYDPATALYVMGYSPWPGYTTQMALRVATSPEGPFSPPLILSLPGCVDALGGEGLFCYAAGVQPRFSTPGRLGVGWYDQLVSAPPQRGGYRSGTVAFHLVRS